MDKVIGMDAVIRLIADSTRKNPDHRGLVFFPLIYLLETSFDRITRQYGRRAYNAEYGANGMHQWLHSRVRDVYLELKKTNNLESFLTNLSSDGQSLLLTGADNLSDNYKSLGNKGVLFSIEDQLLFLEPFYLKLIGNRASKRWNNEFSFKNFVLNYRIHHDGNVNAERDRVVIVKGKRKILKNGAQIIESRFRDLRISIPIVLDYLQAAGLITESDVLAFMVELNSSIRNGRVRY